MNLVQSVERALTILEILSHYNNGLGVTELSEKVNLHKSTVYRLLSTLIEKGYVMQDEETNKYKITLKLFEIGNKKVESMDLLSLSKPYTRKLMESVNEVVHLVVRDKNEIIYIDKVEANNTIRMSSSVGKRYPMYCTANGKAILAHLPNSKLFEIWNNSKVKKNTKNTITDIGVLIEQLKIIKEKGYAIDNEECEIGVVCVGAPIFNRFGEIEGAVSISGPSIRMTDEKKEIVVKVVTKCAHLISKELGYNL